MISLMIGETRGPALKF